MSDIKTFIKERDEAMLSLDRDKIIAYCKKYQIPIPDNDLVFWAGVHKSIAHLISAPQEQKECSVQWLLEHGFTEEFLLYGEKGENYA